MKAPSSNQVVSSAAQGSAEDGVSKRGKPENGFTLVELLVVVAVIAILAAMLF